jgi:hypothetical protein
MNDQAIAEGGSNTGAVATVEVSKGQVISVTLHNERMYWYDGAWHPYPKGDKVTVAKS